jgi:4-amino-4-deoxy-L-arabinose transferase-like glycosyltransferase
VRLGLAIAAVVAVRLAVQVAMPQAVASDGASYWALAHSLSTGGPMRDTFGQIAFYSPGYPLLLAPLFALLGAHLWVAMALNLALAAGTAWLLHALALRLSGSKQAALIAVLCYAVWMPALLAAATLSKENLSTPLMLGFLVSTLAVADNRRPLAAAVAAGLCYGAGLLAGASSLFVVAGFGVALFVRRRAGVRGPMLAFAAAALLVAGPWLLHTSRHFGHPVLATNGGFNLYLGNNPAATGTFVSIAQTPLGPRWAAMRKELGEDGSAAALGDEATAYAMANPARTAALAATKLGWFWAPNIPDAAETASAVQAAIRWGDVVQHALILVFALAGLWALRRQPAATIVLAVIAAFWMVHALTYVMVRYREPVMPVMIALAAMAAWQAWLRLRRAA